MSSKRAQCGLPAAHQRLLLSCEFLTGLRWPALTGLGRLQADWTFGMMPYGAEWKQHRRVFHQFVNQHAVAQYHPIIVQENLELLRQLKADPENFMDHMKM